MRKKVVDIFLKEKEEKIEIIEKKPQKKKKSFIFFVFIVLIFSIWFSFSISKVKIEIWPRLKTLNFNTEITLNKEIKNSDFEKRIIPANFFVVEDTFSDEFLSTGKIKKEEKAKGRVRIFNNSTKDQVLIQNTRLQAPIEKFKPPLEKGENPWFRTLEKVIIPAKGYADVNVIAEVAGEKYNIEPSTFSIPGLIGTPQYTLIYGKSFEPMKGGGVKEISIVTKEDIELAQKNIRERAEIELKNMIKNKLPSGFEFLDSLIKIEILEEKPLVKEGEEKEKFSFETKMKGQVLSFEKEKLNELLFNFLSKELKENTEIIKESLQTNLKLKNFDVEKGVANLLVEFSVKTYNKLNLSELKNSLSGKNFKEAKFFLENEENIQKVKIKIFPFWITQIPKDTKKIEILYPRLD
jgi:hypothetical protein